MSESKHTPGPWELGHDLGDSFSVVREIAPNCGQLLITAECSIQKKYLGREITRDTALANARLVVAAPELLYALKRALAVISQHYTGECCARDIETINAAIAKAEGTTI